MERKITPLKKPDYQPYRSYLPTAFDETPTMLEKVNKLIEFLNKVVEHTNNFTDFVEELLKTYGDFINENIGNMWESIEDLRNDWEEVKEWLLNEGLKEEVANILNEWLSDGTLADIINEEVFNMKADKTYVDEINEVVQENKNILDSKEINVKFPRNGLVGAKGDGVTNDYQNIQTIIDYVGLTGGTVFFPDGDYLIGSPLNIPSNVRIKGNGYNSTLVKNNGNYFMRMAGTFGNEMRLSSEITTGNRTIKVSGSHNLKPNDLILLKSQRNALSTDAGEQWQLGGSTGGTSTAYFGEFLKVSRIESSNTFIVGSGVIYPDYKTTNIGETDPNARESSTVQKVEPVQNVIIENLRFKGDVVGGVSIIKGYNVITKNLIFEIEKNATTIVFRESFMCKDEGSKTFFNPENHPANHYDRNCYKVTSSQSCGFIGSYCEFGTQPFDFNFLDMSIVTTYPFLDGVETKYSTQNGMTSHGGTYAMSVINSRFTNCVNYGISTRTRNSLIANNIIQGTSVNTTFSYGMAVYEGSATDCIFSGNQVSGFNKGVTVIDGTTREKLFKWVGLQVINNVFKDVNRCITFELNKGNDYSGNVGVQISNNTVSYFTNQYAKYVSVLGVNGVKISDNVVNNPFRNANAGVYIDNGSNIVVSDNLFNNLSPQLWVIEPEDGKTLFIKFESRYSYNANNIVVPDKGVNLSTYFMGSFMPRTDGKQALGWSGGRWSTIWAVNGTISTSDRNLKDEITEIPDEWLKAWGQVRFKRYKMKESVKEKGEKARWHIGLVAQDIDEAFRMYGLDATEIGLLCIDEWEENGEKIERWSIRSDECMFLESEYKRKLLLGELNE